MRTTGVRRACFLSGGLPAGGLAVLVVHPSLLSAAYHFRIIGAVAHANTLAIWGSMAGIQGSAEQLGGNVDDGDHALIGHAGGAYRAAHAQRFAVAAVGRRHHAAIAQYLIARFVAEEDLHAVAAEAL